MAVIVTGVALTVILVFYHGGVFNNGVIFHSLPGVSSASSSDTTFPRFNCLLTLKGKNQNPESIMIKVDTTLIHL